MGKLSVKLMMAGVVGSCRREVLDYAIALNEIHLRRRFVRGPQVGRALAPEIEDGQLMPDQHGFGDNGTESTWPRQSGKGDDQMNEYDSEVARSGNGIN
jgi:hypothetical protein